jgi:glycosyltransferase involved in cell wall biosynthesis
MGYVLRGQAHKQAGNPKCIRLNDQFRTIISAELRRGFSVPSHRYPLAVVIPTFNRCSVLAQCMQHLENQTLKDFQVVVVDDGSTDATADQMKSYAQRTPLSFRYVRQDNGGPARARNHAISLINAPICLMIGDDILVSPGFIEQHLQHHVERPDSGVAVLGLTRWSDIGQTVTPFMRWLEVGGLQFNYGPLLAGERADWRHFYTSNLSVKTEILKRFPFDESFPHASMEDMELACRIEALYGLELVFAPEALAHHLHPTSFVQACNRMIQVGESTAHFDQIWPERIPRRFNLAKRALERLVLYAPHALPFWIKLASQSLKLACPNPMASFVLNCHFAVGYKRYVRSLQFNRQGPSLTRPVSPSRPDLEQH